MPPARKAAMPFARKAAMLRNHLLTAYSPAAYAAAAALDELIENWTVIERDGGDVRKLADDIYDVIAVLAQTHKELTAAVRPAPPV